MKITYPLSLRPHFCYYGGKNREINWLGLEPSSQGLVNILPVPKQKTLPSFRRPSHASLPLGLYSSSALGRGAAGFRCACSLHYWLHWIVPSSPTYCQMFSFSFRTWSLLVIPTNFLRRFICSFVPVLYPEFSIRCHVVMLICWPQHEVSALWLASAR